ncbi:PREDICTED: uncharacterized protein LOC108365273 [Rhagoletis zephyria]|uniref:uncharacterized protein LOC108365273 n=1 Tax=Rhagoletis zephyria TaxID=28612 RepID=UPI00081175C8|nr:PREDICTED: uncharacterized protein LOC108365273 [Rhagoletis zephyria]XP_036332270.1 uncharacterized protein LOC118743609 [Rhagoletis pomonella]
MDSPEPAKTHYVRCLKCNKILDCSRYDTNALLEHIRTDHPELEVVNNGSNGMPRNGNTAMREAANNIVVPHETIDDNAATFQPTMLERTAGSQSEEFERFQPRSTSSREHMHIRSQRGIFKMPVDSRDKMEMPNCDLRDDRSNDGSTVHTRRYQVHTPSSHFNYNEKPKRSLYRTSIEKWRPATGTIYCPKCGANRRPLIRTQTERSSNNSCCAVCILGCWPFCFLPFLLPNDNKEYLHCSNCKTFLGLYDRANNCVKPNREYCQTEETLIKETDMRATGGECKEKRSCRCA